MGFGHGVSLPVCEDETWKSSSPEAALSVHCYVQRQRDQNAFEKVLFPDAVSWSFQDSGIPPPCVSQHPRPRGGGLSIVAAQRLLSLSCVQHGR